MFSQGQRIKLAAASLAVLLAGAMPALAGPGNVELELRLGPASVVLGTALILGMLLWLGVEIRRRGTAERELAGLSPPWPVPPQADEDATHGRAFLDLVIENIPAMLFVKDARDGRFILLNRAGEALLGYGRSEVVGRSDHDLFPKDQADSFAARDREAILSGRLRVIPEEAVVTRFKGVRLLSTREMPVLDEEGRPRYLLGLSEDVTERKALERELSQARKMDAIGNLTGGVAHDFNNLLGIIIGNLDLMRERCRKDPELDELSQEALDAAARGADLARRLLAIARRQPLRPERIDINELVTGAAELLRRTLGEAIEIALDLEPGIWPVIADPVQLGAALTSLASNARDAMPRGGRLTIATGTTVLDADYAAGHPDVVSGDYAAISIGDNGPGMTREVAARLFEPFFTTKEGGRGTGLGLSIVFGFVKQSGGHIDVESEVGAGTAVRLYLPRADALPAEMERMGLRQAVRSGRGERILVVEGNADLRRVAVRQLTDLGYRAREAESASAALAILESGEPIDLLFTDILTSGKVDGLDLARAAISGWPATKVVLTSGFPVPKLDGERGPIPGMCFLRRPYRKKDLARVLREALDGGDGASTGQ